MLLRVEAKQLEHDGREAFKIKHGESQRSSSFSSPFHTFMQFTRGSGSSGDTRMQKPESSLMVFLRGFLLEVDYP